MLTPQSWIGKIGLWSAFLFGGMFLGRKSVECPPTTAINIEQKNKVKKGSSLNTNLSATVGATDCDEWLKSLSMKEVRSIRK